MSPTPGDDTPAADTPEEVIDAIARPHRPPVWAPIALIAFVGLVVATNVANAVWASWSHEHPAALLALSSRNRYLALSIAGGVDPVPYVVIATLRISAAFTVCHLIGRAYHDRALGWTSRYLGQTPEGIAAFQRGYGRAEWALVPFFVGSNIVGLLSGVHRSSPARLAGLLALGIAGRLALFWWLADVFEEQLTDVLGVVQRYQWWVIAASIALVVLVNGRNLRQGRGR